MNIEEIIEKAIESNPPFDAGLYYNDPKMYAKDVAGTAINLYKEEFDVVLERLLGTGLYYAMKAKTEETNKTIIV